MPLFTLELLSRLAPLTVREMSRSRMLLGGVSRARREIDSGAVVPCERSGGAGWFCFGIVLNEGTYGDGISTLKPSTCGLLVVAVGTSEGSRCTSELSKKVKSRPTSRSNFLLAVDVTCRHSCTVLSSIVGAYT